MSPEEGGFEFELGRSPRAVLDILPGAVDRLAVRRVKFLPPWGSQLVGEMHKKGAP